ncbi:MAG: hypothetical protein CVU09_11715 [Bacteroidetes bacterium HGW-Bacteroidetes-4]|jgi:hypothetical protein|nr:MAG: hypothetical protein CVU09_11715 [Bacteroidetes bacterium HGW-Bacteroidetes-4]
MKKLIVILLALLPMLSMAQESQLNTLFEKYSGKEGYTSVYITSYMFDLFAKISDKSDPDLKNLTKSIKGIKILTVSKQLGNEMHQSFYNEIQKALPTNLYNDFMIVKEGTEEIVFKVRESNGKIVEFVMIVKDPNEPVLLFFEGDINLNQIAKMSKTMNVKGFEHLEKVEEEKNK